MHITGLRNTRPSTLHTDCHGTLLMAAMLPCPAQLQLPMPVFALCSALSRFHMVLLSSWHTPCHSQVVTQALTPKRAFSANGTMNSFLLSLGLLMWGGM